ncbi:unnamed protein product [Cyclocybe aegerita]|uniref:BZIP domain-containing protein n=1 Tax=Cyclocybe aegerita TaxID=1973307 RepID=A0A8S0WV09_CYCAE|nr:unnamed protein product [Cyclocybe aegerita]
MLSFTSVGQASPDASQNIQTMRLRDDPPPITQPARPAKKRKTPPNNAADHQQHQQPAQPAPPPQQQQQPPTQPQPPAQPIQHVLPPAHTMMHPIPGPMPPGYPYAPADYTPGGMPPNHPHPGVPIQQPQQQQAPDQSPPPASNAANRTLSNSKRAEQNRKAQRAFRERRDQHVKALESRSQLLDAALASADEANRRWEECRALVDQLRVENAALRAALSQAHLLPPNLSGGSATTHSHTVSGNLPEEAKPAESSTAAETTTAESAEKSSEQQQQQQQQQQA